MAHRAAPMPHDEIFRIDALEQLGLLDSLPELAYDDVVRLANAICGTPIGLVSLVDRERQWFKSCIGLDVSETHRDYAFCAHAILQPDEVMVVEDATQDARFN
ncbi:MAG: GGDEF domain-containing protein, partial [Janthinobacterium lividum]